MRMVDRMIKETKITNKEYKIFKISRIIILAITLFVIIFGAFSIVAAIHPEKGLYLSGYKTHIIEEGYIREKITVVFLMIVTVCMYLFVCFIFDGAYKKGKSQIYRNKIRGLIAEGKEDKVVKEREWEKSIKKLKNDDRKNKEENKIIDLGYEVVYLDETKNIIYDIKRGHDQEGICKITQYKIMDKKLKRKYLHDDRIYYYEIYI